MKIQFKIQEFQTKAVKNVVEVFKEQPKIINSTYRRDIGSNKIINSSDKAIHMGFTYLEQAALSDREKYQIEQEYETAYHNARLFLTKKQLLKNIRLIQNRNNIKLSSEIADGLGAVSLDVEMETGTGKTYVYIKTMFELYKAYGWSKFIIVVPSIAIREGVKKSFELTEEHFMENYGQKARVFIYNSSTLHQLDEFSQNNGINVMIINIQAFNTTLNENKNVGGKGGNKTARIIYTKRDEFASRRPIDVIKANNPIIILDEPQKMGGIATQNALKKNFNPLFSINYSATHKTSHNLIYVLDALDAYKKKLVKKIEVKGFELKNLGGANRYIYLSEIIVDAKKPPRARLEFEVKRKDGPPKREVHLLNKGTNLYSASKGLEQYKDLFITDIDPIDASVNFSNGTTLASGQATGNVNEYDIRRIQISETIKSHFEKEEKLFEQNIKCLSLFFIDEVAKYRSYDENGHEILGEYGQIFNEEYERLLKEYSSNNSVSPQYQEYLNSISAHKTHKGYFSIDRKGHIINSSIKRGSDISDDISAYDLILKDKERLLSLNEQTRFIFSHSALREGWDNPNIFQICTLKHSDNSTTKRQEVGRGLRLCVDTNGQRQDLQACGESAIYGINLLTVISSESYTNFVASLQNEIKSDLYERPRKASEYCFKDQIIYADNKEIPHIITQDEARAIYNYLIRNNYVDDNGAITEFYKNTEKDNFAPLKQELEIYTNGIHKLIQNLFDESILKDIASNGHNAKIKENILIDENWLKFKELWEKINSHYSYTVDFDSQELIEKSAAAINKNLNVERLSYILTKGSQDEISFKQDIIETNFLSTQANITPYDLVGKIAEATTLTRHTTASILKKIRKDKFKMFPENPENFIIQIARIINEQKASVVVEHISYTKNDQNKYSQNIFNMSRDCDEYAKALEVKNCIQTYLFPDSDIEKTFAEKLDKAKEVNVYAKLPRGPHGFYIPTPLGNYSPDWAISFKKGKVKHIFFIAETKGSLNSTDLRIIEKIKTDCAKKLFKEIYKGSVRYHTVATYEDLFREATEAQ
jgi:type III restriction enzyme